MKDIKYSIVYKEDKWKTLVTNIGTGIFSGILFLGLLFGLHWNIVIDIILSAGFYMGLSMILKPEKKIGSVSMDQIDGGEELEKQLQEAKKVFLAIQESLKKIKDSVILQEAEKLNQISAEMITYLENHPDKIVYARQFIDYYQGTESKILARYAELENTGLQTKDILKLKENTTEALHTLHQAFEQQFQKLVQNEMIDMEAEIRLLEQTVKMEKVDK